MSDAKRFFHIVKKGNEGIQCRKIKSNFHNGNDKPPGGNAGTKSKFYMKEKIGEMSPMRSNVALQLESSPKLFFVAPVRVITTEFMTFVFCGSHLLVKSELPKWHENGRLHSKVNLKKTF